jgi:lysophospholipase L1-like esterase
MSTITPIPLTLGNGGFADLGIHPNDYGYMIMAQQIEKILEQIIADSDDFRKG